MKTPPSRAPLAAAAALCAALAPPVAADVVVLKSGKKLEDVVVSRNDDELVVINPWNSRHPDMDWEIPEENRIPRDQVAEVVLAEPPLVEYRERASRQGLTVEDHLALAQHCETHGLDEERERHLQLVLAREPDHPEASKAYSKSKWERWARGNPLADPELAALEREYLALTDPPDLKAHWSRLRKAGYGREVEYLERARRSAAFPAGRRNKVPLTHRSDEVPGATYCIYVPRAYDPLVPTPLVVALHGGGPGGVDETLVTGSGESAMNFYQGLAETRGWIVACPSALAAPWAAPANEPLIDVLLEELLLTYNVDENRIYLTGHSMGGFGTWYWGPERAEVWAAIAPCAGGGGPRGVADLQLPVYIYHSADDAVVRVSSDRTSAKSLAREKDPVDFVYTEFDGVGHGFPDWVRREVFRFFAGRWKDRGKRRATGPLSSFERKVEKAEVATFGDPSKLPKAAVGETPLKDLVEALEKGGGGGQAAVDELAGRKDRKTVKAVAKVLKSKRSTTDAKVLAARALGAIGLEEGIKPLAAALDDEDYRVLDEATAALGEIGLPEASAPLARAAELMGEWYDDSFQGAREISTTEYQVRLKSFRLLADALAAVGDADAALPVLEKELVERVLTPRRKPRETTDPRFAQDPPNARKNLCRRLVECLVVLEDERGLALLESVAEAWPREPNLGQIARRGIERLRAALDEAP